MNNEKRVIVSMETIENNDIQTELLINICACLYQQEKVEDISVEKASRIFLNKA